MESLREVLSPIDTEEECLLRLEMAGLDGESEIERERDVVTHC